MKVTHMPSPEELGALKGEELHITAVTQLEITPGKYRYSAGLV